MRILKIAMLAATLLPLASYAALGGAPNSSSSSPSMLRATPKSAAAASTGAANATATAPYTVRESLDADGVTIREYVLPSNVVFAVTWEGPIRPDMKALLGSYFPNYVNAGESRVRGPGPMVEGNDDFRVESAGRLGHFFGVAYLPRLKPASVRPGDLK
ncbi:MULTISPECIES: DUF2844 domain-containing protein [Paraburkholderia]|uniref:DUF2844 domain-containing protein n=1 Tax=Paraburkholderia TaxID=1822464 RepID=UPI00224D642C|nr:MULTISPECIES: DUF2844 domain-containing protein [Paraburkholderia]MCX4176821.1 DUF2844 domain-containing protein [Paraburkholderia madseniana]MDQ6464812.1 DUF2844 domain-containing protein [Paraburkholderia madseniana]